MSDISIDVPSAESSMRSIGDQSQKTGEVHQSRVPVFPPSAAGRGFVAHGQRLGRAFDIVHQRGAARLAAVSASAQAAVEQFAQVEKEDERVARAISRLGD